jgi:hypothetical protein
MIAFDERARFGLRGFMASCLICGSVSISACGKPPSHDECSQLLDHYVDLLVKSDRPGTSSAELHKLELLARQKSAQDPAFEACNERVSRRAYECAMSALTADKLEQCLL